MPHTPWPLNLAQPKSCKICYEHDKYECAHPWEPKFEIPIGDPITGRARTKTRPDTGTYEGGTFPEDAGEGAVEGGAR